VIRGGYEVVERMALVRVRRQRPDEA